MIIYNSYQNIFLQVEDSSRNNFMIELLDRLNRKITLQIYGSTNTVQICPSWSECEDHVYQTSTDYQISLYIIGRCRFIRFFTSIIRKRPYFLWCMKKINVWDS
uniref:Uncharacterized protein n=1 Tax=Cacopsylla melanoneura TaxID=428564 RepID=A0A8D9AE78_9HEMI